MLTRREKLPYGCSVDFGSHVRSPLELREKKQLDKRFMVWDKLPAVYHGEYFAIVCPFNRLDFLKLKF